MRHAGSPKNRRSIKSHNNGIIEAGMSKRTDRATLERLGQISPMLSLMGVQPEPIELALGEKDFWPTPLEAVAPLIPHLQFRRFIEPCAGDGALIKHLSLYGVECVGAGDVAPRCAAAVRKDVFDWTDKDADELGVDCFITNPPWSRSILHPLIDHLRNIRPTWLLFDADWMHTVQAGPIITGCSDIVSVGRVKWIPDSPNSGMDNAAWYLFDQGNQQTIFHERAV
jgi:hypothetical protein